MPDLDSANFETAQSDKQPTPATIASAATVVITGFMTFITGTVAIVTITPPLSGLTTICLVFTTATPTAFSTAGNVKTALAPAQNVPVFLVWNPVENKWYPK